MPQTKTVAVEADDRNIQRLWDESDLVTDGSAFPQGYGILLNERLMFPEDLCLWRMNIDTTRQLFVDDHLIAHQCDLKRKFHSPEDHPANPLLPNCWRHYGCPGGGARSVWWQSARTVRLARRAALDPQEPYQIPTTDGRLGTVMAIHVGHRPVGRLTQTVRLSQRPDRDMAFMAHPHYRSGQS